MRQEQEMGIQLQDASEILQAARVLGMETPVPIGSFAYYPAIVDMDSNKHYRSFPLAQTREDALAFLRGWALEHMDWVSLDLDEVVHPDGSLRERRIAWSVMLDRRSMWIARHTDTQIIREAGRLKRFGANIEKVYLRSRLPGPAKSRAGVKSPFGDSDSFPATLAEAVAALEAGIAQELIEVPLPKGFFGYSAVLDRTGARQYEYLGLYRQNEDAYATIIDRVLEGNTESQGGRRFKGLLPDKLVSVKSRQKKITSEEMKAIIDFQASGKHWIEPLTVEEGPLREPEWYPEVWKDKI